MTRNRGFTLPQKRTTEHLAPREQRAYMGQTEEQIALRETRQKIEAIHEIQALGQAVAEVWDD